MVPIRIRATTLFAALLLLVARARTTDGALALTTVWQLTDEGAGVIEKPKSSTDALAQCSIEFCGQHGKTAGCTLPETGVVASCGGWTNPPCNTIFCTAVCFEPLLRASDGSGHCSSCALHVASCRAGWAFHGPVGDGDACSTQGVGRGCAPGETCVLDDFGRLEESVQNAGTCISLGNEPVPQCSLALCARNGASTMCAAPDSGDATRCAAYAARADGGPAPDCAVPCTRVCASGDARPVDSAGNAHCNECVLMQESCRSGFAVYGPVSNADKDDRGADETPEAPEEVKEGARDEGVSEDAAPLECVEGAIPDLLAAACCREHRVGCLPLGALCHTAGEALESVACAPPLRCVVYEFGAPDQSVPNEGVCTPVTALADKCSIRACAKVGAIGICVDPVTRVFTRCGSWATRSDGHPAPKCDARDCGKVCEKTSKEACDRCRFEEESCRSNFSIHS